MVQPGDRREFLKKAAIGSIALASVPTLGGVFAAPASAHKEDEGADKVRWDIISLPTPPPLVFNPDGVAFASAAVHDPPTVLSIRFTGSGTFVAPASGEMSSGVTGGGTWETFSDGASTGSGTYRVKRLARWQFANLQTVPPAVVDNIGNTNERANGTAVLLIKYSDGSRGILGVGCHGPGAPLGIHEGVIATKGFVTYWNSEGPTMPFSNKNRTVFHVRQEDEEDDE